MPIGRLHCDDLETFIADEAAPDALWFFLHVPKTAGSSLSAELRRLRPPYRNIHLSEADYRTGLAGAAFWAQLEPHIDQMLADHARVGYRSASGHLLGPQARRLVAAVPGARIFTFLRNPVDRVVSDYRYQRSPAHPAHAAFAAAHPTIDSYLATPDGADKMYHHLRLAPDEPVEALIARLEATFAFVGIVEMYPFSFNVLTRLFGDDRMPLHRERTTSAATAPVALTPELRERIRDRNRRDGAIYWHFHDLLMRHRDPWRARIAAPSDRRA